MLCCLLCCVVADMLASVCGRCQNLDTYGRLAQGAAARCYTLLYTPNTEPVVNAVMNRVAARTGLSMSNDIIGLSSRNVGFGFFADNIGTVPYILNFRPEQAITTASARATGAWCNTSLSFDLFYNTTYTVAPAGGSFDTRSLALQWNVEQSILDVMNTVAFNVSAITASNAALIGAVADPTIRTRSRVTLKPFTPAAPQTSADDVSRVDQVVKRGAIFIIFFVIMIALAVLQAVAREKQGKMLGILRLMGLSEINYWSSWFLCFFVVSLLSALIAAVTGVITGLAVFKYADFAIHFVALFLFMMVSASLCVLVCLTVVIDMISPLRRCHLHALDVLVLCRP